MAEALINVMPFQSVFLLYACLMTVYGGQVARMRPASITVHHHGDVLQTTLHFKVDRRNTYCLF